MKQKYKFFSLVFLIAFVAVSSITVYQGIQADEKEDAAILQLHQQSQAFVRVAKDTTPAVVHISVSRTINTSSNPFNEFFRNHPQFKDQIPESNKGQKKQTGAGSGVIIDPRGYIISNNHVVDKAEEVTVTLGDKRTYKAKVIGTDSKTDVSVLKIDGDNLPVAPLGNSDALAVGQWVLAIGNPFGLSQTVTAGIVSAKGRSGVGITEYEDFIQTDAAINPGNSGGPLVNLHGEVIGINTAIFSRNGGYQGIGFAIPVNLVRKVMQQIIENGKVSRSWLGVQIEEINNDTAEAFGLNEVYGCLVQHVVEKSPAEKGGLEAGDIILHFNGIRITSAGQLRNIVAMSSAEKIIPVEIFRNQRRLTMNILLGDLEKANWGKLVENGTIAPVVPKKETLDLGIEIEELTPELAKELGTAKSKGIVITNIIDNSSASRSSLRKGDIITSINRIRVNSISDVKKVMERSKNSKVLLLRVITGTTGRYVVIKNN